MLQNVETNALRRERDGMGGGTTEEINDAAGDSVRELDDVIDSTPIKGCSRPLPFTFTAAGPALPYMPAYH